MKNGHVLIEKIEEDQKQFKSKLNEINTGNPKHKLKDQLDIIKNIENLYNSKDKVIKLYNDYAKILSESMYVKQNKEQELKNWLLNKCFKDYQ